MRGSMSGLPERVAGPIGGAAPSGARPEPAHQSPGPVTDADPGGVLGRPVSR